MRRPEDGSFLSEHGRKPHREQLVVSGDYLPCKARLLGVERVLPIQHSIQDDAAAPDVRFLQVPGN